MPYKRSVRRTRKRSTLKVPRYSSMSNGFGGNNLIASSPNSTSTSKEEPVLKTYEDFKAQYDTNRKKLIKTFETELDNWKSYILNLKLKLPANIADVPLKNMEEEGNISEIENSITSNTFIRPRAVRKATKATKTSDDEFKRPGPRRPRNTLLKPPSTSTRRSAFKTPNLSTQMIPNSSSLTITPKMNLNTPMNIMRRPRQGEVAVSMTGSPLMVSTVLHDALPTVTVPFSDGRVFSILPNPGTAPSDMPEFDESTKELLNALRANLELCCKEKKKLI